ncbi:MAG TPA: hypothetical protein VGK20_12025 [Candidatus Binatia bacterium]|jgi:hypothetical protein
MYRSWAYILMVIATLVGIVALVWPSPQVRTIEEIAMPSAGHTPVPHAEAAGKAPKNAGRAMQNKPNAKGSAAAGAGAGKTPPAAAAPAPTVVTHLPASNTTTRRAAPIIQNGMQPNMFGKPVEDGTRHEGGAPAVPPAKPSLLQHPVLPPRPGPQNSGQNPPAAR